MKIGTVNVEGFMAIYLFDICGSSPKVVGRF